MLNVLITLLFAVIMAVGQIILSFASKDLFLEEGFSVKAAFHSNWLWLGIFIYAFAMILWIYILSRFDLRYAYPISAMAIFFAAIFQSVIQKSFPSSSYWAGLMFVIVGLAILSLNKNN
jgi:undecaprenyl phosphate-alpha-L-ara4N flippase subunit ArnE